MLADPQVNRAVIASLGAPSGDSGQVSARSRALWATAIGLGNGFATETADLARAVLPDHLAIAFRGVLSFWTAGEISDIELEGRARAASAALLLGVVDLGRWATISQHLEASRVGGSQVR